MSKLEELKKLVADQFKAAEDKDSIEKLAAINNSISEVEAEHNALVEKNADLIKSYKDLVKHTSFRDAGSPADNAAVAPARKSLEEALQDFINNKK